MDYSPERTYLIYYAEAYPHIIIPRLVNKAVFGTDVLMQRTTMPYEGVFMRHRPLSLSSSATLSSNYTIAVNFGEDHRTFPLGGNLVGSSTCEPWVQSVFLPLFILSALCAPLLDHRPLQLSIELDHRLR